MQTEYLRLPAIDHIDLAADASCGSLGDTVGEHFCNCPLAFELRFFWPLRSTRGSWRRTFLYPLLVVLFRRLRLLLMLSCFRVAFLAPLHLVRLCLLANW